MPDWTPAYVAIGSNLDDPPSQLRRASASLGQLARTRLVAVSRFYRNPPMGSQDQPHFVNAVVGLLTQLPPRQLLDALKEIERAQGRVRAPGDRWGPRIIDLDLLVHGRSRVSEPGLAVPHPGIADRNFVLFPLLDIAPGLDVPGVGSVAELSRRLDRSGLEALD